MKTLSISIAFVAVLVGVSCSDSETGSTTSAQQNAQDAQRLSLVSSTPSVQLNYSVYHNGSLYDVILTRLTKPIAALVLESGDPFIKIFATEDLSQPQPFHPVIDVLINQDFNPHYMLHLITFNSGVPERQFSSMNEIDEAFIAGEITITNTEQLYRRIIQ